MSPDPMSQDGASPESASPRRPAWPVGAVLFALALALAMAGYAADVASKSRGIADTILIVPAAAIGIVALLAAIAEDVAAARRTTLDDAKVREEARQTRASLAFMALLVAYVAAIPHAGFDAATFVFLAASLALQGERRPLVLIGFAALVTAPVVWIFVALLSVRLPTLLF
ncbi:hypothetical protein GCM10011322_45590 [Salinarimonas ramus]|uniref:DUF1468 domain-containing protein n=2 Tax=Salinarimonas ramus TaxID=690164 RepID=A0A917V9Q5_9HYPH|nr:hypothetical protein GCM10011322_45590 [Salinarimonas ramus]